MELFRPEPNKRLLRNQLVWFIFWVAITLIGAVILRPSAAGHGTHRGLGLPPCPAVVAFDRPCPGCGLTTSWTAVLHGDFAAAWSAHPFGALLYILFTVSAILSIVGYRKGLRLVTDSKPMNAFLGTVVIAFLAYGAVRFATKTYGDPDSLPAIRERLKKAQ